MPAIEDDYVTQAQKAIKSLTKKPNGDFILTTNQLRNLLSLSAQILDEAESVSEDTIPEKLKDKVQYLRVRIVYQAGKSQEKVEGEIKFPVKEFVEKANLISAINEIRDRRDKLIRFCRYMEALVAYRKYLDPKD
jgi:CRISPR-associated protein Csm2